MSTTRAVPPPADPQLEGLLDQAEEALDGGDPSQALEICKRVLATAPDHAGAHFLVADAMRQLGELDEAVARYRRVTHLAANHALSWSGLAFCLFDLLDFPAARNAALRAIRIDPDNPEAYYVRALLRERRTDYDGAERDFLRAERLDPVGWPRPVPLSDAMVEAVVAEALQALHPTIRAYLHQVPVMLEEVPSADLCFEFMPPAPPGEILGTFAGASLRDRSVEDPWSQLPGAIVLFRRNLQRVAADRERLLEELRVTVFHEVGHFLGLDEDDMVDRGLD